MKKPIHFNYSDFDFVKNMALTFPDTEESVSHEGTPSVKMRGKLICRLHDNGEFIPIRIGFESRDYYLETYPEIFHLPDHFKNYPYLCMWKDCHDRKLVAEVLEICWRSLATKKQIKDFESGKKSYYLISKRSLYKHLSKHNLHFLPDNLQARKTEPEPADIL